MLSFLQSVSLFGSGLDLHNHLFIDEGIPGFLYKGCFSCPIQTTSYSDLFKSKANKETLESSGLDIVVASLYAHPLGVWDMRDSIRRQITLAKDFVNQSPGWVLARRSSEARRAILSGKRVLVLALDVASGILETKEDFEEFLVREPIAIVTPLHFIDDQFGGAALMRSFYSLVNPLSALSSWWSPTILEGVSINKNGLTNAGRKLIAELVARKVWIDLTHASDLSQMEIISTIKKANQPLLYSHTTLREYMGAERALSQWQIAEIGRSGGMVGLLPSMNYLKNTDVSELGKCKNCNTSCKEGIVAFAQQVRRLGKQIGFSSETLGSDFNAPLPHLAGGCEAGGEGVTSGLQNMSDIKHLWESVNYYIAPDQVNPKHQVQRFLNLWQRVRE